MAQKDEGGEERVVRLASIVAIDVAGFSSMSERDQGRAARKIETLGARIRAVAGRNEGRVFNTAGDGFMLEFQSAGSALGAINELLDRRPRGEPNIRIGAHVGDVVVTLNNDLLGHGVNVAARLQSLATPNTALVSGEFRSMARSSPSAMFQSRGRQPLQNIEQRVATFAIVPQKVRRGRLMRKGAIGLAGAAAVALVAVFAGPQVLRYIDQQDIFANSTEGDAAATAPEGVQAAANLPAPPPAPAANLPAAGETLQDCPNCPEMIVVAGGSYLMGSPDNEPNRYATEGPQHEVTIQPIAVGIYEITFAQWDACLAGGGCNGFSPTDRGWGRGRRPVVGVSWNDAQAYLQWLSSETGETYRLPTEAEWEYVARAGTTSAYAFGARISTGQAKFGSNRTDPVGSYEANAFGVYDVHGNAWEWTADCFASGYADAPNDGTAFQGSGCSQRVYRGGGYRDRPSVLRSANRRRSAVGLRDSSIGFRVVRELD